MHPIWNRRARYGVSVTDGVSGTAIDFTGFEDAKPSKEMEWMRRQRLLPRSEMLFYIKTRIARVTKLLRSKTARSFAGLFDVLMPQRRTSLCQGTRRSFSEDDR